MMPPFLAYTEKKQSEIARHDSCQRKRSLTREPIPSRRSFFLICKAMWRSTAAITRTAIKELLNANQNDAFIQCLIGQTYEKLGDEEKAGEYYSKAAAAISHNPAAAYAVPFAKKRLGLYPAGS